MGQENLTYWWRVVNIESVPLMLEGAPLIFLIAATTTATADIAFSNGRSQTASREYCHATFYCTVGCPINVGTI